MGEGLDETTGDEAGLCSYLGELMDLVGVDLDAWLGAKGGGWKEPLALEGGPSTSQSSPPLGGNAWQGSEMSASQEHKF